MGTKETAMALAAVANAMGETRNAEADAQEHVVKSGKRSPKGKAKGRKSRNAPLTEEQIRAKYPHVVAGSVRRGRGTTKMSCRAQMPCGHERVLFTSDLFQVHNCGKKACAK